MCGILTIKQIYKQFIPIYKYKYINFYIIIFRIIILKLYDNSI